MITDIAYARTYIYNTMTNFAYPHRQIHMIIGARILLFTKDNRLNRLNKSRIAIANERET